jgi:hypothetical protein
MTNCLNPVLDAIRFWAALEWVLARTAGLERQPDSSLRAAGPTPDWLKQLVPPHPTPPFSMPDACADCVAPTACHHPMQASHPALTDPAS